MTAYNLILSSLLLCSIGLTSACLAAPPIDPKVRDLAPSATLEASRLVRQLQQEGRTTYNWGLGACPFPVPEPMIQAVKDHAHCKQYAAVEGVSGLADAIAARYSTGPYQVAESDVLVASGLKQLIFDAQRAFGGRIIHSSPFWVSYAEQTQLLGKTPLLIHTSEKNDYKLQPQEVEAVCKQHPNEHFMLIFNHPVNPTGVAYTAEELSALAKVLEQYKVTVFADEVYLGCHHFGDRHSIAEYLPEQTIRASSLSKEFAAGGYRLGWATFPKELRALKQAMAAIGTSSYSCAPVPLQYAAMCAMQKHPTLEEYLDQSQRVLAKIGFACYQRFQALNLACPKPDAAWYLFVDFEQYRSFLEKRGIHSSAELSRRLLQDTGIVMVPGSAFGRNSDQLVLRASYVDFDGKYALEHVKELEQTSGDQMLAEWAPKLDESIEKLGEWLREANL